MPKSIDQLEDDDVAVVWMHASLVKEFEKWVKAKGLFLFHMPEDDNDDEKTPNYGVALTEEKWREINAR